MVFGGPSDPRTRKNDPWRPPGGPRASAARRVNPSLIEGLPGGPPGAAESIFRSSPVALGGVQCQKSELTR